MRRGWWIFLCRHTRIAMLIVHGLLRGTRLAAVVAIGMAAADAASAQNYPGQSAPLSRGWYRVPYEVGEDLLMRRSLFKNGHNGYDMRGQPELDFDATLGVHHKLLAAADGEVIVIEDGFNECGGSGCNNKVILRHPNGEYTAYYHIKYLSATTSMAMGGAGLSIGDWIMAGDMVGEEGDVGSTTGSCDRNREKLGCDGSGPPDGCCGIHLHLTVAANVDETDLIESVFSNQIVPQICGANDYYGSGTAGNNVFPTLDVLFTFGACHGPCGDDDIVLSDPETLSNEFKVYQATDTVTSQTEFVIQGNNTTVGFQAGDAITLKPGFRAASGTYFRASIGACNTPPF